MCLSQKKVTSNRQHSLCSARVKRYLIASSRDFHLSQAAPLSAASILSEHDTIRKTLVVISRKYSQTPLFSRTINLRARLSYNISKSEAIILTTTQYTPCQVSKCSKAQRVSRNYQQTLSSYIALIALANQVLA